MFDESKPFTFDRVTRMLLTAAVFAGLFLLVRYLGDVLIPFVAAAALAYLLNPLVTIFERRLGLRRPVAVAVTLVGGFFVGFSIALILALVSVQQINQFDESWQRFRTAAVEWINARGESPTTLPEATTQSAEPPPIDKTRLGLLELREGLAEFVREPEATLTERLNIFSDKVEGTAVGVAMVKSIEFVRANEGSTALMMAVMNRLSAGGITIKNMTLEVFVVLSAIVLVLIYLIFLLLDYPKYRRDWPGLIPPRYRGRVLSFFAEFDAVLRRYFRGQSVIAMTSGVLFAIGFWIIGLPMAVPFGLFVGSLTMVPYLQAVGAIPAVGLAILASLTGGRDLVWMVVLIGVIFAVVQLIQETLLVPRIMGKAVGLSPIAIMLGVFIWGKLLGFLGLLLAIPLTCLGIAYYRRIVLKHSESETSLTATPE